MLRRAQLVAHGPPYLVRRRVGRLEFRVCLFKGLELLEEPVVLGVGDDRVVEDVVAIVVVAEGLAELLGGVCCGLLRVNGVQVEVSGGGDVGHQWLGRREEVGLLGREKR